MQVDSAQKKILKKFADQTTRVNLAPPNLLTTKEIPASVGANYLDINRTSIYYKAYSISKEELECKEIIGLICIQTIQLGGARQMSAQLKREGYQVGRRKGLVEYTE